MRRLASLVIVFVIAACAVAEQAYKIEDLGPILDPIYWTEGFNPVAINNSGVVVGYLRQDPVYSFAHSALRLRDGSLRDLGTFDGTPFEASQATAINARGDVVGWSWGLFYPSQAFVARRGSMELLGVLPGGTESAAFGINDRGEAVGTGDCLCQTANEHHALLFADGAVHDLGTLPGGRNAGAVAINNRSQIVGTSDFLEHGRSGQHAFLYDNGRMVDLGALPGGFEASNAMDINERGQVVGLSARSSASVRARAFLYEGGTIRDLGGQLDRTAVALAINNQGLIVGWTEFTENYGHAAIFGPDGPVDLNELVRAPEWELIAAIDVNDGGDILGYGFFGGNLHGFLLEKVPLRSNR